MNYFLITVTDKLVYDQFVLELEEKNIPFRPKFQEDTSFPGLEFAAFKGQLEIDSTYQKELQVLLPRYADSILIDGTERGGKSRFPVKTILLALYAAIMTIMCARYYYQVQYESSDKNFRYEWNSLNTIQKQIQKSNGRLVTEFFDEDYDGNWEKIVSYIGIKNKRVSIMRDEDEDGYIESMLYLNARADTLEFIRDTQYDPEFDYMMFVLDDGKGHVILRDNDHDGYWEFSQ